MINNKYMFQLQSCFALGDYLSGSKTIKQLHFFQCLCFCSATKTHNSMYFIYKMKVLELWFSGLKVCKLHK